MAHPSSSSPLRSELETALNHSFKGANPPFLSHNPALHIPEIVVYESTNGHERYTICGDRDDSSANVNASVRFGGLECKGYVRLSLLKAKTGDDVERLYSAVRQVLGSHGYELLVTDHSLDAVAAEDFLEGKCKDEDATIFKHPERDDVWLERFDGARGPVRYTCIDSLMKL